MAGSATNYAEDKLLGHALGVASFTMPSALYVALFNNTSGNAAANLEANILTDEISAGGYARTAVTFTAPSGGSSSNSATVTFPAASADWGTVTHLAVVDAASGTANAIFAGDLLASKIIQTGDVFQLNAGNLTITLA
jgi:hypothetical protein